MKQFLYNLLLFVTPCAVLFILPLIILFMNKEFLPLASVVREQQGSAGEVLYLPGLTSAIDNLYKIRTTIVRNPEIIVFGTSRTLTIKSSFFNNPEVFYNAGYTAGETFRVEDALRLINTIPTNSNLKVILFDVSSFFKKNAEGTRDDSIPYTMAHTFFTAAWRDTYRGYFNGDFSLSEILHNVHTNSNIGMRPRLYGVGYRKDGSLERNMHKDIDTFHRDVAADIQSDLTFIVQGHGGFPDYSDTIPEENIQKIKDFLQACKERNIYVIGYFSPNAMEIHQKMSTLHDKYGESYRRAPTVVGAIFQKAGFPFYNMQDLYVIDSSDSEMYDPHHPTEKASIKLLMYLTSHEPILNKYLEKKELLLKLSKEKY